MEPTSIPSTMWKSTKLHFSPGFLVTIALSVLAGAGPVLPHVLLAALCHELGHLAVLRLFPSEPAAKTGRLPVYLGVPTLQPFDCIVPVPPRLGEEKGLRIPEQIARRMGKILELPVSRALRPTRKMEPQKGLDLADRLRNRKKGYVVCDYPAIAGRRVLLVDDICTTGATLSACARVLREAGAADVVCAAAALTRLRAEQGASTGEKP